MAFVVSLLVSVCSALQLPQPKIDGFDPLGLTATKLLPRLPAVAALATTATALPASAKDGAYGLAEGRIISMVHPTVMMACFGTTLFAAYTGFQWRRLRELNGELAVAKKTVRQATATLEGMEEPAPATVTMRDEAQAVVDRLAAEADAVKKGNFKDVHYTLGTVLLGIGIPFAIEGPVNTYMRASKLFPGPHLYAGAAVVSLWALSAALVPYMQKGKDWARSTHIGLNAVTFGLFAYYQIPTGLEITGKVIKFTKFP